MNLPDAVITSQPAGHVAIVPLRLRRRGASRQIAIPNGRPVEADPNVTNYEAHTTLQRWLCRAFRWLAQLETGAMPSIKSIAEVEGLDCSYASRVLGLTLLPPDMIAAILDDADAARASIFDLVVNTPLYWSAPFIKPARDHGGRAGA